MTSRRVQYEFEQEMLKQVHELRNELREKLDSISPEAINLVPQMTNQMHSWCSSLNNEILNYYHYNTMLGPHFIMSPLHLGSKLKTIIQYKKNSTY